MVSGHLYDSEDYCRNYTFAPCDHHTEGRYGPCPKTGKTPKCEKKCREGYEVEYKKDKRFGSSYGVSGEKKLQTDLMKNGPIEVGFNVYEDFLSYKEGVYQHTTGKALGGHAVKLIGWGVENGVKYWTIANSWNEDWGDKGFFKILRGKNHCGIESGGATGIPK